MYLCTYTRYWDNTWYLDGERYLWKNGIPVCMIQPMFSDKLTRYMAHQPDYKEYTNKNSTFLLNHNKTANALFEALNKEREILFRRDQLCEKINYKIAKEKSKYMKSDEFIRDLAELSFENYYDILALKNNTNLSAKEKKEYIGDYCDYDSVYLKDYITWEESEKAEAANEDYEWNYYGSRYVTKYRLIMDFAIHLKNGIEKIDEIVYKMEWFRTDYSKEYSSTTSVTEYNITSTNNIVTYKCYGEPKDRVKNVYIDKIVMSTDTIISNYNKDSIPRKVFNYIINDYPN